MMLLLLFVKMLLMLPVVCFVNFWYNVEKQPLHFVNYFVTQFFGFENKHRQSCT